MPLRYVQTQRNSEPGILPSNLHSTPEGSVAARNEVAEQTEERTRCIEGPSANKYAVLIAVAFSRFRNSNPRMYDS